MTGALIEAAVLTAAAAGAPALEAYPVDTTTPGHTGNLFPGVASTFAKHGFAVVARPRPDRPIMRRRTAEPPRRESEIDQEALTIAAEVLGTKTKKDTVNAAVSGRDLSRTGVTRPGVVR